MSTVKFTAIIFSVFILSPLNAEAGVSRVSHIEGTAAVQHRDEVDWREATANLPLREGDRFFVQENSRLEIEFDDGSFLRLDAQTDAVIHKLTENETEIEVSLGDAILRVNGDTFYTLLTPSAAVYAREAGLTRVSVESNGQTRVAVRKGAVEVAGKNTSRTLQAGQVLTVLTPEDSLNRTALSYARDDFDLWSERRDARYVTNRSKSYLGRQYAGAYDLDRYGRWSYLSSYGYVWWPNVAFNWCPYRNGYWSYYPGWAWTWISYDPWGWLPYHYGSWSYIPAHRRWCWVPGGFSRWSPSTANFFFGNGFVGWAPRPFEELTDHRGIPEQNRKEVSRRGLTIVPKDTFLGGKSPTPDFTPDPGLVENLQPNLPPDLAKPDLDARRRAFERPIGNFGPLDRRQPETRRRSSPRIITVGPRDGVNPDVRNDRPSPGRPEVIEAPRPGGVAPGMPLSPNRPEVNPDGRPVNPDRREIDTRDRDDRDDTNIIAVPGSTSPDFRRPSQSPFDRQPNRQIERPSTTAPFFRPPSFPDRGVTRPSTDPGRRTFDRRPDDPGAFRRRETPSRDFRNVPPSRDLPTRDTPRMERPSRPEGSILGSTPSRSDRSPHSRTGRSRP